MGTNFNILALYGNNGTDNINNVEKNSFLNSLNNKNSFCNITDYFISSVYDMSNNYDMCFINFNPKNTYTSENFNNELYKS